MRSLIAALKSVVGNDLVPAEEKAAALPDKEKRDALNMFYKTLLTAMGREGDISTFEKAIKQIPAREIDMEFDAVMDGTVSKIVKTLVRNDLSPEEQAEMGAIFQGLAQPYFRDYKGDVPQEDLEWAHNQIKDFFEGTNKLTSNDPKRLE